MRKDFISKRSASFLQKKLRSYSIISSKFHLAFGLAILTLGAQLSARECPTSGIITYSCDVTSPRTNQFLFNPTTAITVNVNANITKSSSTVNYLIQFENQTNSYPNNIFTNTATIDLSGGSGNQYTIWNYYQKIYSFTNSGTINASDTDFQNTSALRNDYGTIISLQNSGTIGSTKYSRDQVGIHNFHGTIGTISNSGFIYVIKNNASSEITKIINTGHIRNRGVSTYYAAITNSATIGTIRNEGYIDSQDDKGTNIFGIRNEGTISLIENLGRISSRFNSYDISNKSNSHIGTLINDQGKLGDDPLSYKGYLPTNYQILINSATDYGQLLLADPDGTMTFSIAEDSDINFGAGSSYTSYDSTATLNPASAYKINSDKDITIVVNGDVTVTGPEHNLFIEDAADFNLTVDAGITYKNESGAYGGQTYASVLQGLSYSSYLSATSGTTTLDGTPVEWSLSQSGSNWDLTITQSGTAQAGEVVHIDDESLVDVNITNNGTIWSTENNAIAFDGTTITGTATITNASGATLQSDSTATDEAALLFTNTTGTINITNAGTITSTAQGILNSGSTLASLTNSGTLETTGTGTSTYLGSLYNAADATLTTLTNSGTMQGTGSKGSGIVNLGTITTLTNSGTLQGTGATLSYGLYSSGTITTLTNSGTIASTNSTGLDNSGSINSLSNTGTIQGTGASNSFGLFNSGTITSLTNDLAATITSTNNYGLYNTATITRLYNEGTVSSTNSYGLYNTSSNTIVDLENTGTISSSSSHAIVNTGTITDINNLGTLSGASGKYDINNAETITHFYNLQGAATTDPLTLTGTLPRNYYLVIDSTADYGQLSVTSGSGSMNFSLSDDSVIGVPDVSYTEYASSTTLNPAATTPYEINAIGTAITIEATSDWTVAGPVHNITVDNAESFSLTVDAGVTVKNNVDTIAGASYSSVLSGVSQAQLGLSSSSTSSTVDIDGTDVTLTLSETSDGSGTWDLSTSTISSQSGRAVNIDDVYIAGNVTITNNGTIWSTENNAIAFDNVTLGGTTTITNASGATLRSDSTATDEAALLFTNTTGTVSISNVGTITSSTYGIYNNNSTVTLTNTGTITSGSGSYDINNTGTMTIYNKQGYATSDPLTLTGTLPTYYMTTDSTSVYGQLAVTNGTGTLTFNVTDTDNLDVDAAEGTYASVLSGVPSSQITDLAQTFTQSGTTYEWQLELSDASTNTWRLDIASVDEIMDDNAITFPNYIAKVDATLNHGVAKANFAQQQYQCNVFAENNGCFAMAGRYTDMNSPSSESQAAVFIGGYNLPQQKIRLNAFVDQSVYTDSISGIKLENHGPLVGFNAVWQQNNDGTGLIFKIGSTYQSQDAKITRNTVFEDSEAGQGSTDIETQTYRAEWMYGYLYNKDTFMNPYLGVQYTLAEQDGYTESASGNTSFPLTFSSIKDETTTVQIGLSLRHRLSNAMTYVFGSFGAEHDVTSSSDSQVTASYGAYSFSANLNNDNNETRANASMGFDHYLTPTQKITTMAHYQELAWGGSSSNAVTGYIGYSVGF